jgi:phosphate transport system substrate-binding protein
MKKGLVALIASIMSFSVLAAGSITGAGASFPYPVYAKWAEAYKAETGNTVNYQSIGSSGGIKQIDKKTVDFGASDVARSQEELDKMGQVQFPMVMGGVVVVVNLPEVKSNELNLSLKQVADIFSGVITNWKDVQSGLPDLPIAIVHRSDGSGTTAIFTGYLAAESADFKTKIGEGKAVKWQGNTVGGKGNAGVAAMVGQIKGTIGYVEYAYAKQNGLTTTKINGVEPSAAAFKSGEWKLTASTFIIVYPDGEKTKDVYKFVEWCYNNDSIAESLDYVPLSDKTKDEVRSLWTK